MIKKILGYNFNNPLLLEEALTHPSNSSHNHRIRKFSYERLEFLGDSVLNLVITENLLKKYPHEEEGNLAKRRSGLVSGATLASIAISNNLGELIYMTEAEEKLGGRDNPNALEDVLEAIIGAIYLDGGFNQIKSLIEEVWQPFIDKMIDVPSDPKSKLQELLQKNGKPLPIYEMVESYGPKHMITFKISLVAEGFPKILAEGKSKQAAEKEAAAILLKIIEGKI